MILEDIPDDTRTSDLPHKKIFNALSRPRPNVRSWAAGYDLQLSRDLWYRTVFPRECSMFVEEAILNMKPVFLCFKIDNCSVY